MATCPVQVFPPALRDKTFSLIMTVVTPLFVIACVAVFMSQRNNAVFIRKRPLWLVLTTALAVLDAWAITPLYDVVGAQKYPCWLFGLMFHMFIPLACVPLALKTSIFFSRLMQIKEELRPRQSFRSSVGDELDIYDIASTATLENFAAHIRVTLHAPRAGDRQLSLEFSKSIMFTLWWSLFIASPSIITFVIRIATEPLWNKGCYGCEAGKADMGVSLFMYAMGAPLGILAHSRRIHPKDPLRIVRECHFGWRQGFIPLLGAALWFADPGKVYANGYFNWRMLIMIGGMTLLYVETIHQVIVAKREKAALLTTIPTNRAEAFANMMKDKEMREAFRNYLNSELSPEIYLFMESVEKFKAMPENEARDKRARKIFDTFIPLGASYEVNLSAPIRYELLGIFAGTSTNRKSVIVENEAITNVDTDVFDKAYSEIKEHLLNDSFLRFFQRVKSTRSLSPINKNTNGGETPRSQRDGGTPRSGITPKKTGSQRQGFFLKDARDDGDVESRQGSSRMVQFIEEDI